MLPIPSYHRHNELQQASVSKLQPFTNQPPYAHDQATKGSEPMDLHWATKEKYKIGQQQH